MYMTAGLLMPIMATIGAGVDLGQAYMAKGRLQQACDAGVLAGRKKMADGQFTTQAEAAANRMFEFNFPSDMYGSTNVTFTPVQRSASEVTATATATVNTIIMNIFGKQTIPLSVSCTAKLEIANADIMLVLDTTGSMANFNSGDSVSRLDALKTEVMSFFDTITDAQAGDSVIRFGVVPYSSNVNVGQILRTANPNWLSTTTPIPSRTGQWVQTGTSGPTTTNSSWSSYSSWVNTGVIVSGRTSSNCSSAPRPATSIINGTATTTTNTTGTNPQTTTTSTVTPQTEQSYRNFWTSSACREQRRTRTRNSTTASSVTREWRYTYQTINYDVSGIINGSGLTVPTGPLGANVTASWNGCILERDTVAFASNASIPSTAYDLDIDLVPTSNATRWGLAIPNIAHPRNSSVGSSSQTSANVTTTSDFASYADSSIASLGYSACPTQAMKLTAMTSADRATMQNYVNSLIAIGGTYHDVGMVWGARLVSPTGLFASENATAPNGMPISRHIIFMTDGEMAPNGGIYGFQGQEFVQNRVGGTSNSTEYVARHNARFLAACDAAKSRNITVWMVSFGTALTTQMQQCASGDKAYTAANNAQLRTQFQAIAQQITRLRISE
ncbi:VWA domain-containing protein [Sphingomonas lacunae]|nr:VWA domain-containing protein [Sphingomonas lacunae]